MFPFKIVLFLFSIVSKLFQLYLGVTHSHVQSKQCRKNDVKLNIRLGGDLKILKTEEYEDTEEMSVENDQDSNYQSGCDDNYSELVLLLKDLWLIHLII